MKLTLREKVLISIFNICLYCSLLSISYYSSTEHWDITDKDQALQERIEEIDYFITSNSPIKDGLQAGGRIC